MPDPSSTGAPARGAHNGPLKRLAQIGIATFLLISAFDIHRWRRAPWQDFNAYFVEAANGVFGQPPSPLWLYALAFPLVAVNFAAMVQIVRGRRTLLGMGLFWPFTLSALAIAIMPLIGGQYAVTYRIIWADILTLIGYAIGGAIATLLHFERHPNTTSAKD